MTERANLRVVNRSTAPKRRNILVTGYAKAPAGTSMYEIYKHAGIVLEIDPETDTIVDAQFTVITGLASRFLQELLVGHRVDQGLDELIRDIRARYVTPSQEALIKALRVAVQRYQDHKAGPDVESHPRREGEPGNQDE